MYFSTIKRKYFLKNILEALNFYLFTIVRNLLCLLSEMLLTDVSLCPMFTDPFIICAALKHKAVTISFSVAFNY